MRSVTDAHAPSYDYCVDTPPSLNPGYAPGEGAVRKACRHFPGLSNSEEEQLELPKHLPPDKQRPLRIFKYSGPSTEVPQARQNEDKATVAKLKPRV